MQKTTGSSDVPAFGRNDGDGDAVGFGVDGGANGSNKKSKQKLSKSKNPRPTGATEERNFLTSDAKTDFRF